ncbi:putative ATPase [Pseudomonas phage POR1]|uniref:Putative ATPase n=1 Tax=Pseudomonas phage POR1 TaxID=1718594 RepID=A0A0N9SJD0_9CAUD|nr:putative ATPase [Pseudomonas phage POR1]
MALNWFTTDQYQNMHGVKCGIYGAAGVGKTSIIATMPNPFVISIESGMLSLRKYNIHGLIVNTLDDFRDAISWLNSSNEARQFASVGVDSISELAEKILEQKLLSNRDGRKAYGEMQQELTPWIKSLRDLPGRNVVFTFKEEYIKDEMTGAMKWAPSMPGKQLVKDAPYWFDELFRAQVFVDPNTGIRQHMLQCQRISPDDVKDRSGVLEVWEQPNLSAIFQKIATS